MNIDVLARSTLFTGIAVAGVDLVFDTYYLAHSWWLDMVTYEAMGTSGWNMIPFLLILAVRAAIYYGVATVLWRSLRGSASGEKALFALGLCILGGMCNMYGTGATYEAGHSAGFAAVYWMATPSIVLDMILFPIVLVAAVLIMWQRRRLARETLRRQNDVSRVLVCAARREEQVTPHQLAAVQRAARNRCR